MRPFGTLIEKTARMREPGKTREPAIPEARLERVRPASLSRLDEAILEMFDHACIIGDLDVAADLVVLMERRHARVVHEDEQQKRIGGVHLKRMWGELDRRYIMKGIRPPCPELRPRWRTG
jgi:hypothetical protein